MPFSPMRRKDREIVNPTEITKIMSNAQVGRIGLSMNEQPYVVPINFAFDRDRIYFHCADTGMKLDFLRTNPRVCFEVDENLGIVPGPAPWLFGFAYRSVIAFGIARILTDSKEKTMATRLITTKYAGKEMADMITPKLIERYRSSLGSRLVVVEIKVESITGKHREISSPPQSSMSMRGPPSFSQTISSDLDQAVGSAGLDCRQTRASKETPIPAILPGLYVISGFMAMSRISCMEP